MHLTHRCKHTQRCFVNHIASMVILHLSLAGTLSVSQSCSQAFSQSGKQWVVINRACCQVTHSSGPCAHGLAHSVSSSAATQFVSSFLPPSITLAGGGSSWWGSKASVRYLQWRHHMHEWAGKRLITGNQASAHPPARPSRDIIFRIDSAYFGSGAWSRSNY